MEQEQTPPSLQTLLDRVGRDFEIEFEDVSLGGKTLSLPQIKNMQAYIDKLVARAEQRRQVSLPLWAKIWPSCLVLARLIQSLDPGDGRSLLDIGSGVGLIGLTGAQRGFKATLVDIEPTALDFAGIAAAKNGLEGKAETVRADFTKDDLGRTFDLVVGCEVFYKPESIPGLAAFMDRHLDASPGAEIILAMDEERRPGELLRTMSENFAIRAMDVELKVDGEDKRVSLFRLRRKDA